MNPLHALSSLIDPSHSNNSVSKPTSDKKEAKKMNRQSKTQDFELWKIEQCNTYFFFLFRPCYVHGCFLVKPQGVVQLAQNYSLQLEVVIRNYTTTLGLQGSLLSFPLDQGGLVQPKGLGTLQQQKNRKKEKAKENRGSLLVQNSI